MISSPYLRALHLGEIERQQVAGHELGQEALGRGDADLRAGVGVHHRIGLPRDGRAVGVADRQHPGALGAGVPHRLQGVCGLAGLADRHHQGVAGQDRVAVAELRGQLDLDRDPGPVLDGVLRDHAGIERRPTRHDDDLVDVAQFLLREPHLVELQRRRLAVRRPSSESATARGCSKISLRMNQSKPSFSAADRSQSTWIAAALARRTVEVGDLDRVPGDRHDLVLAELERLAGVLDEGGHVGAEEVLTLARARRPAGSCGGRPPPATGRGRRRRPG